MLKLKTKWFNTWAKKNGVADNTLLATIKCISTGLGVVKLGEYLYKVRMPRLGQGKSGGYRTIVVLKEADIALFIYAFSKNEKDNLDNDELNYFKKFAKDLMNTKRNELLRLEKLGAFVTILEHL